MFFPSLFPRGLASHRFITAALLLVVRAYRRMEKFGTTTFCFEVFLLSPTEKCVDAVLSLHVERGRSIFYLLFKVVGLFLPFL